MPFKSYKEASKEIYGVSHENPTFSFEQLQFGAIQRIADAAESMARNITDMQRELEWYKKRNKFLQEENEKLQRSIVGLKGVIGRYKKQQSKQK